MDNNYVFHSFYLLVFAWMGSLCINMYANSALPITEVAERRNACKSGAAKSGPARYTHEPAPHQALGLPEPTTIGLRANSTQKISLMGEDCPHLYVALRHHQFPMWD
jgi:hypothetical protein